MLPRHRAVMIGLGPLTSSSTQALGERLPPVGRTCSAQQGSGGSHVRISDSGSQVPGTYRSPLLLPKQTTESVVTAVLDEGGRDVEGDHLIPFPALWP